MRHEPRHSPIFLRPRPQRGVVPGRATPWFWVEQPFMPRVGGCYRLFRRAGCSPREARQQILYLLGTHVIS